MGSQVKSAPVSNVTGLVNNGVVQHATKTAKNAARELSEPSIDSILVNIKSPAA